MKTIEVRYWHLTKLPNLSIKHGTTFQYSTRKRNSLIDKILNAGYNVMITHYSDVMLIWVDNGRFQQR